jgi:hypothetical protein
MIDVSRLLFAIATALFVFGITMIVYGLGLAFGLCTWSPQLVTLVGLNDFMVAAVLWMFWD